MEIEGSDRGDLRGTIKRRNTASPLSNHLQPDTALWILKTLGIGLAQCLHVYLATDHFFGVHPIQ